MTTPEIREGALLDGDYTLAEDAIWLGIEGLSIRIFVPQAGRVYIAAYLINDEMSPPVYEAVLEAPGGQTC